MEQAVLKIMMYRLEIFSALLRQEAKQQNEKIFRLFPDHMGSSGSPTPHSLFGDSPFLWLCRVFSGIKSGGDTYFSKLAWLSYKSRWHAWMHLLKCQMLYRFSLHNRAGEQRVPLEHKIQQRWETKTGADSTCKFTILKTSGRSF